MPRPQRIVVAINPSASFGRNKALGPKVVERLQVAGHEVEALLKTDFAELLASSRAAIATRPDAFVVVGGDGMVNLGVNVVARTGVPMGIVPAGTGNDMARALGIPFDDQDAAIDILIRSLEHEPMDIDAGLVRHVSAAGEERETWFACMVSAGFDARVNERANRMRRPRGASRYTIALVIELVRLRPLHYTLVLDGETIETKALLVSVGNGPSLGGGMKVTPDAMLDDGLFDILVVRPMSRFSFLRIFPRVFAGTHVTDPRVSIHRAAKIAVASSGVTAYGDGEPLGPLPIDIEVVPGALRVIAPEPQFESPVPLGR